MEISILNRTTKKEGGIYLRFRLRDGRAVDLTHRSRIYAELADLAKFTPAGKHRKQVSVYNAELERQIAAELSQMRTAYEQMRTEQIPPFSGGMFSRYIEHVKHPEISTTGERCDIISRLERFCTEGERDGVFATPRADQYRTLQKILRRFLTMKHKIDILPGQFSADDIMLFREYLRDEYKYTQTHPELFAGEKPRYIPTERRSSNTIARYTNSLCTFFADLETRHEITRSPFAGLSKERKHNALRQRYSKPVYLTADELAKVRAAAVPEDLQECKDAFLLQCAIGCRVGDFAAMRMRNISVTADGIPYVHYLPQKTANGASDFAEVETPILHYALAIVTQRRMQFDTLRTDRKRTQYNDDIRRLLQYCGIDRKCTIHNDDTDQNEYVPIYTIASSKTARKTHIDMLTKVQVNMYAAGLHKPGSDAVKHYTELTIKERFALLCAAFNEPQYKVDTDLKVIEQGGMISALC